MFPALTLIPTTMVLRMLKTAAAWATSPRHCFRVALRSGVEVVRKGSDFSTDQCLLPSVAFPLSPLFMCVKLQLLGT